MAHPCLTKSSGWPARPSATLVQAVSMIPTFRCVLVDDDPDLLESMSAHLAKSSACLKVVGFSRAPDAVEFLKQNRADAIVSDLRMPELPGPTLIEAIRRFDDSVPVVLISNDETAEDEALAAGASLFLRRSELTMQLLPALEQLLRPAIPLRFEPLCPQILAPKAWLESARPPPTATEFTGTLDSAAIG
jgi:CheY-like chemotaxis protein